MSEHNEQQPLTRRERREREMGETGALDLSEVAEAFSGEVSEESLAAASAAVTAEVDAEENDDVEVSAFNEDGSPRSRREMRQLREEALAAQEAARAAAEPVAPEPAAEPEPEPAAVEIEVEADPEPEPEVVAEVVPEVEPTAAPIAEGIPEPVSAETHAEDAPDFDTLIAPPTEPFSVAELQEASQPSERSALFDAPAPEAEAEPSFEAVPVAEEEVPEVEAQEEPASGKPKRRFPWNRNKDVEEAAPPVVAEPEIQVDPEAAVDPEPAVVSVDDAVEDIVLDEAPAAVSVVFEDTSTVVGEVIEDAPEAEAVVEAEPTVEAEPVAEAEDASETATASETPGYSFPDIVPPEEWRSVFDDPASRTAAPEAAKPQVPGNGGDFDDLISRAVAQEGAAGTSNTSALILPSMPEDTGGLSGPLGSTGEYYLTGSIELPKSMGETGGHSSLLDSVELDPFVPGETTEPHVAAEAGPTPVSARQAVSARVPSGVPVVAKPTKERSKLPLVLSLTGGGLLAAVIAYVAWAASQGMFG